VGGTRRIVGPVGNDYAMRFALCAVVAFVVGAVGTAHADPTPPPSPYQIQGPNGPVYGGMRTLPPICGNVPRACGGDWNPDTGAWDFPGTASP
jgi:hypothetical protein